MLWGAWVCTSQEPDFLEDKFYFVIVYNNVSSSLVKNLFLLKARLAAVQRRADATFNLWSDVHSLCFTWSFIPKKCVHISVETSYPERSFRRWASSVCAAWPAAKVPVLLYSYDLSSGILGLSEEEPCWVDVGTLGTQHGGRAVGPAGAGKLVSLLYGCSSILSIIL